VRGYVYMYVMQQMPCLFQKNHASTEPEVNWGGLVLIGQ